jgi:hypothetical protein
MDVISRFNFSIGSLLLFGGLVLVSSAMSIQEGWECLLATDYTINDILQRG